MALQKSSLDKIPPNARILSKEQALDYQWKRIENWKSFGDSFNIYYGSTILAVPTFFYGFYITNYYRRKFKLRSHGGIAMTLPVVFIPAAVSTLAHYQHVLPNIILQDTCPVCLQVRSAAFQTIIGTVMPTVLAVTSALLLSTHFGTYNVPYITVEPKKVVQLLIKLTQPTTSRILNAVLAQAMVGMGVTYFQQRSIFKLNETDE